MRRGCRRLTVYTVILSLVLGSLTCTGYKQINRDRTVKAVLDKMTLEQKITQTFMMSFTSWNGQDMTALDSNLQKVIEDYDFGAVILFAANIKSTEETVKLTHDLQAASASNEGIPLIIATDQEGGVVNRLGSGTSLPGNMALAATGKAQNATVAGQIIGSELMASGINASLSPVVDVNCNANNPVIGLRSFSDNPSVVGEYATAMVEGMSRSKVISCAKHFPGHGDTATDSHYGLPIVDKSYSEVRQTELKPYESVIDQGIDMIMTAHILYPQLDNTKVLSTKTGKEESRPATMSRAIITDILKGKMGFGGVVITDAMNMAGITDSFTSSQAVIEALLAGADMICMPVIISGPGEVSKLDGLIGDVKKAVESGYLSEERLNDAVYRILTLKEKKGILNLDPESISLSKASEVVGCKANKDSERKIASKAVTLIRNEERFLPMTINEDSRILMMCPYSNELGQMAVAWNRAVEAGKIPKDLKPYVYSYKKEDLTGGANGISGEITGWIDKADTVIILSEVSSASKMGYSEWNSAIPNYVAGYAHSKGKKVVVISADKPYDVQLYPDADAVLAVYGCKGSSIDVTETLLNGNTTTIGACGPNIIAGVEAVLGVNPISGKLPVDIPQFDAAAGRYTGTVLYRRGYGIKLNQ